MSGNSLGGSSTADPIGKTLKYPFFLFITSDMSAFLVLNLECVRITHGTHRKPKETKFTLSMGDAMMHWPHLPSGCWQMALHSETPTGIAKAND